MAIDQKPNRRWNVRTRADGGLGRMFILSLGVHLALLTLFMGPLLPRFDRPRQPVYYVDLIHTPVADPQAGRPDAPPAVEPPKMVDKIVEPPAPPVPAKKATLPAPKRATAPKKAPSVAPEPLPRDNYAETQKAMREMQEKLAREREYEALKERLAALAADDAMEIPPGAPAGRGTEEGVEQKEYIRAYIQSNWSLSRYQVSPAKAATIEAVVLLSFDASGTRTNFEFVTPSGDTNFDDSLKTAILKSKQLPKPLGRSLDVRATFNLKEMMDSETP